MENQTSAFARAFPPIEYADVSRAVSLFKPYGVEEWDIEHLIKMGEVSLFVPPKISLLSENIEIVTSNKTLVDKLSVATDGHRVDDFISCDIKVDSINEITEFSDLAELSFFPEQTGWKVSCVGEIAGSWRLEADEEFKFVGKEGKPLCVLAELPPDVDDVLQIKATVEQPRCLKEWLISREDLLLIKQATLEGRTVSEVYYQAYGEPKKQRKPRTEPKQVAMIKALVMSIPELGEGVINKPSIALAAIQEHFNKTNTPYDDLPCEKTIANWFKSN
ncbi:hypothetical protein K6Q96_14840 [Grimontia kaedaensis]|uniref:Uncharacterized protein n=1 Tax=Grimontia kaedaensis TaxID=2872157 RepID=A0ABY4WSV5_9GAMM|nr:hypothetical protein [Grimontia kaedaensis]USH02125.1 hypothetical protein K6Q96_14840 [Grimontia kaedaensis]